MKKLNYNPVWDSDLSRSISSLTAEGGKLKAEIFKGVVMGNEINMNNIRLFEAHINEFLKYWSEHAESLRNTIREISDIPEVNGLRAIEYEYVKPFIYGSFDYSSVLQYTAGVLEGIDNGTFDTPEKITDFKEHALNAAFNNQEPDLTGLMDSVLQSEIYSANTKPVGVLEKKMFLNLKGYEKLFPNTDRNELYRATERVVKYVCTNQIMDKKVDHRTVKLFISFVNNVVEYMIYSLASYACRVFVISLYCQPFIRVYQSRAVSDGVEGEAMSESTTLRPMDVSENPGGMISSVFQNTDGVIISDPAKAEEFFNRFSEFMKLIGADALFGDRTMPTFQRRYYHDNKTSKFRTEMDANAFFRWLKKERHGYSLEKDADVMDVHTNLKGFIYNQLHGIQGPTTERQALLLIIKNTSYGESHQELRELAKDLYLIALELNQGMRDWISNISQKVANEAERGNLSISSHKFMTESLLFMMEFYQDCMMAIAQKASFIERRINELNDYHNSKFRELTSINIKGINSDANLNIYMGTSVPTQMRIPMEKMDSYTESLIDYYEMYDEYLRSLPQFANDWYLSEAIGVSVSGQSSRIMAILDGIQRAFMNFYNGAKFKEARNWVKSNGDKLMAINFGDANSKASGWFPYKKDFTPPDPNFARMIDAIEKYDPKTSAANFAPTLYPSNESIDWYKEFTNDKVKAATRYKNVILYDLPQGADYTVEVKAGNVVGGDKIKEQVRFAIDSINSSERVIPAYNQLHQKLKAAVMGMNQKIAGNTSAKTEGFLFEEQLLLENPEVQQDKNAGSQQQSDVQKSSNSANDIVQVTNQAIMNLWVSYGRLIMEATRNQYTVIKEAYGVMNPPNRN